MYFERCPAQLLATVVLRGAPHTEMKFVKSMLAATAYIAADLAAEACLIFDFGGTIQLGSAHEAADVLRRQSTLAGPPPVSRPCTGSPVQTDETSLRSISPQFTVEEVLGSSEPTRSGAAGNTAQFVRDSTATCTPLAGPSKTAASSALGSDSGASSRSWVDESSVSSVAVPPVPALFAGTPTFGRPSFDSAFGDLASGRRDPEEYFLAAIPAGVAVRPPRFVSVALTDDDICKAAQQPDESRQVGGPLSFDCMGQPADRLWSADARTIRIATCSKRWDVLEAPCRVPRVASFFYHQQVPGALWDAPEDCQTFGQFLHAHCFNLRRQCTSPKCRESILRHEQCFSHRGGRLSVRVLQLLPENALPSQRVFAWSICRCCLCVTRPGPCVELSPTTCAVSLGRFLESSFYNGSALSRCARPLELLCQGPVWPISLLTMPSFCTPLLRSSLPSTPALPILPLRRVPGCTHSLHLSHERCVAFGTLVCSFRFQPCVVFGITPPLSPRNLDSPLYVRAQAVIPAPLPPGLAGVGSLSPSSAAAQALGALQTLNEIRRCVAAVGASHSGEDCVGGIGEVRVSDTRAHRTAL